MGDHEPRQAHSGEPARDDGLRFGHIGFVGQGALPPLCQQPIQPPLGRFGRFGRFDGHIGFVGLYVGRVDQVDQVELGVLAALVAVALVNGLIGVPAGHALDQRASRMAGRPGQNHARRTRPTRQEVGRAPGRARRAQRVCGRPQEGRPDDHGHQDNRGDQGGRRQNADPLRRQLPAAGAAYLPEARGETHELARGVLRDAAPGVPRIQKPLRLSGKAHAKRGSV